MDETLKNARGTIATDGGSELEALDEQPAAKEMWENIQRVRREKYVAVKKAADEAAAPFDKKLEKMEEEYALLLRLSA